MNRRQIVLITLVVIAAHAVLFWLVSGTSPLPKTTYIPPPNFVAKEATWVDKETGEKITYHEYRVSTKLALPDALQDKKQ